MIKIIIIINIMENVSTKMYPHVNYISLEKKIHQNSLLFEKI